MEVDVNCKSVVKIDIDSGEAFRLLVKTLHMNCILDDENEYCTFDDGVEIGVYKLDHGHNKLVDDRGELYEALMATARCIFPNV